jgi:2',3'-cyclic-nucleotide 2'-phosphodiesterase (5'-nucleotidase family)
LGHLGNEEPNEPSTSKGVLANVKGIDLFIDGHDHELVEEEVEGTLLVETGCWLHNIGLVVIDAGVPTNQSVAYGEFAGIDTATQAIIDDVKERVDKELGVVLAATPFRLVGDKQVLQVSETNLGDLFCDAMMYDAEQATGEHIDASMNNAGGIRSSIEEGDITLEMVKVVLPFTNQVVILKVTGAQLLETIEASCQHIGYEGQKGSLPQVAGIEYTVNGTVPYEKGEDYPNTSYASPAAPGARVTIHSVGGADFDENATYTIATSDYIAEGGSTYHAFKVAAQSQQPVTCDFDYEALVSYLTGPLDHEVPERYREPQGRITIITE